MSRECWVTVMFVAVNNCRITSDMWAGALSSWRAQYLLSHFLEICAGCFHSIATEPLNRIFISPYIPVDTMPLVSSKQNDTEWTLLPNCRASFGRGNLESFTDTTAASFHGRIDVGILWYPNNQPWIIVCWLKRIRKHNFTGGWHCCYRRSPRSVAE